MSRPNKTALTFWGLFALLQGLLHLAANLLLADEGRFALLNLEVTLGLALCAWLRHRRPRWRWPANLLAAFYLLALIWETYSAILPGLFQREANLANDWLFARNLPFLLDGLGWPLAVYGLAALGLLAGLTGVFLLARRGALLADGSRRGLGLLTLALFIWSGLHPDDLAALRQPVTSSSAQVAANLARAQATRQDRAALFSLDPWQVYDYSQVRLEERPDVYLIFIESYGSAVYSRPDFTPRYLQIMADFESALASSSWNVVSGLSESPVWGGGSWMAYTSALFGLRVDNENAYAALRQRFDTVPYPNLPRFFQSQGYATYWFVPISRRLSPASERANERFYGAEQWVRFADMDYHGPLYGWGPSPPDQYTLGLIAEETNAAQQPTFTFFLTQNTHYPWAPLPPRLTDWRDLADLPLSGGKSEDDIYPHARDNYLAALEYTFALLPDFLDSLDPQAIVILIGDHQPPTITNRQDGYTTLVHVLSRDPNFTQAWLDYGFEPGLLVSTLESDIRHEGLYSLLVRQMHLIYGKNTLPAPEYLPEGIPLISSPPGSE